MFDDLVNNLRVNESLQGLPPDEFILFKRQRAAEHGLHLLAEVLEGTLKGALAYLFIIHPGNVEFGAVSEIKTDPPEGKGNDQGADDDRGDPARGPVSDCR